jgi:hypothetical protein
LIFIHNTFFCFFSWAFLAIGISAIVLLRAKRTVAPEVSQTQNQSKKLDANVAEAVQKLREQQFFVPAETGSAPGVFTELPEVLRTAFAGLASDVQVFDVEYTDGSKGFRIDQDVSQPMVKVYESWEKRLYAAKQLLSARNDSTQITISAMVGQYRLVFVLSRLTDTSTGQTIHVVPSTK